MDLFEKQFENVKNLKSSLTKDEKDSKLTEKYPQWNKIKAKRGAKDSVFTDLFSDPKYLLELYKSLFPEDTNCSEDDLEIITLENILLNGSYNDLGFLVKDKLLILVEAQSSWNPNIPMRMLNYVAHSYRDYQIKHKLNMYGSKLEKYPFPEFYVVYTGTPLPESCKKLHLKDCFMESDSLKEVTLDCIVNLIDMTNSSGILTEYISFCTIYNDMVKEYGYTLEAVKEAIRICTNSNILKNYLESREVEVTRILSQVFDQETEALGLIRALEHERDVVQDKLDDTQNKLDDTQNKLDDTQNKLDDAQNKLDGSILNFVSLSFKEHLTDEMIVCKLEQIFGVSRDEAQKIVNDCRNNSTN